MKSTLQINVSIFILLVGLCECFVGPVDSLWRLLQDHSTEKITREIAKYEIMIVLCVSFFWSSGDPIQLYSL